MQKMDESYVARLFKSYKELTKIEAEQDVKEAVSNERRLHCKAIDLSLSKLSGMETALQKRITDDNENRRAKQYWVACQNMVQSFIHRRQITGPTTTNIDDDSRCKPLDKELEVIKQACGKDEFVQNLMGSFSPTAVKKGVYTEEDLKNRFATVYKLSRRVAKIDDNGGGVFAYASSYIQSLFTFDTYRRFAADDKIDPNQIDNYETIARAKYFVEHNDFDNAVRVMQLLRGESSRIASGWIRDTKEHLETRFLLELLASHAAVTNIRSMY